MSRLFFLVSLSLLATACLPDDAYRMKYPQQEISFGASHPLTFKQSEKVASEHLEHPQINSNTPAEKQSVKRKPITQTMKFIGEEDTDTGVKKVPRKQ